MHSVIMCESQFSTSQSIAIIAHISPDADTLASAVALKKLIKLNFDEKEDKIIDIFVDCEEVPNVCQAIVKGVELNAQHAERYDLAICVDCASLARTGRFEEIFKNAKDTLNIDHHDTNTKYANNNIVVRASSTCEGIYLLFNVRRKTITDDACKLLYAGIITDTNNLTQGNITIRTHKVIADFMSRGIDLETLKEHFFKNNAKSKAFLLQKALSNLSFYANDRIAFMKLTKHDFIETDSTFDDSVGIVDHGVGIKGVDIAIIAIKKEDNSFYVSLRGKNGINVGAIAEAMGGGGHETIAAFSYEGTLTELKEKLFALCKEELKLHPAISRDDDLFAEVSDKNQEN